MSVRPSWFWRFDRLYAQQGLKAVYIRTSGLEMNARQLVGLIRRMTAADAAERVDVLKAFAGRRANRLRARVPWRHDLFSGRMLLFESE